MPQLSFLLLASIAAGLAGACPARASETPNSPAGEKQAAPADPDAEFKRIFRRLDADSDGAVTEREYLDRSKWPDQDMARKIWRASDQDGDGKVTEQEYCRNRRVTDRAKELFQWIDADGDGKVSPAEFRRSPAMADAAEAGEAVKRVDGNSDGMLSWPEFAAAYRARHANCPKPGAAQETGAAPEGRGNRSRFAQVFILQNDRNGDGFVDKTEFRGSASRFDQMDKNHNGRIDPEELNDLHTRRMNDPKTMRERLEDGDVPAPPGPARP